MRPDYGDLQRAHHYDYVDDHDDDEHDDDVASDGLLLVRGFRLL